ncbi:MFS transporter [Herbaspirillum chlorophenolicum]|uniref:MFS transporter n=1 Tax=Herbaspirillum chlorophenolicum TaxID=211589 RepID=A0ABW8EZK7_9BURK
MSDIERSTMRKVIRRFAPLLTLCFIAAFLDRVNVGFAAITMNKDLGLSSAAFGLGAGLFFLGYFFFEVPSNMALERFGARLWIARIMLSWGILSGATAFVQGETSFYIVRILLGIAEAGFFPGVIFFLTLWLPKSYRAGVVGSFMAAMPLASVFGSPVSGLLMSLDGMFGMHGWQLMFLIEAAPSIVLAFVVLKVLRDSPDDAEWLSAAEKQWLKGTLEQERREHQVVVSHGLMNIVRSPVIWLLAVAYFGVTGFNYGMSFFLPQIVKGFDLTLVQTGFVSALPFVAGAVGMIWWSKRSDRSGERRFHTLFPLVLAVIGLGGSTLVAAPVLKLALLCLASFGVFSALPVFWTLPPTILGPAALAAGIAAINSIGNLSGFVNPYVVGKIKDVTGSFGGGLQVIALFGVIAIVILFVVTGRHQQRKDPVDGSAATAGHRS